MSLTGWKEKDDRTIAEIRQYLERENLDAFIPWKVPHLAYLTNQYDMLHMNVLWEQRIAVLVIPREDEAFIVGGHTPVAGHPETGTAPWWLAERHAGGRPGAEALERTVALFREKGLDKGRIGFEAKWMPVAAYEHLRAGLPQAELVAADLLIPQIRFVKTPREQALLKKAVEVGFRAMEAYMQAIRSGATRPEAQLVRAQRALEYGGEWVGGPYGIAWTGGNDETPAWWDTDAREQFYAAAVRRWQGLPEDSPFLITHFETTFQYYFSDLAWHELYGAEPGDDEILSWGDRQLSYGEARHDFEVLRRIQSEALHVITPGMDHVTAKEQIDAFLAADAEAKEHVTHYYVHGIGLEIHEEPVLTGHVPKSTPLDGLIYFHPGAVVSSEWFTSLWTAEEPFVMTEAGWEPLVELRGLTDLAAA